MRSGHSLVDQDMVFILKESILFLPNYSDAGGYADDSALLTLERALREKHTVAMKNKITEWKAAWAIWAEGRAAWEYQWIQAVAQAESDAVQNGSSSSCRWPEGIGYKDVLRKTPDEVIGTFDLGYIRDAPKLKIFKLKAVNFGQLVIEKGGVRAFLPKNFGSKAVDYDTYLLEAELKMFSFTGRPRGNPNVLRGLFRLSDIVDDIQTDDTQTSDTAHVEDTALAGDTAGASDSTSEGDMDYDTDDGDDCE